MLLSILKSEKLKWSLTGALAGAGIPILFTLLQPVAGGHPLYLKAVIAFSAAGLGFTGFLFGGLRDKDERYRHEIVLKNRQIAVLGAISETIANTKDLDSLLHFVLRETMSFPFLSKDKKGAIFMRDESEPVLLRLTAKINFDSKLAQSEKKIPVGHCLCGRAAQTGETIVSADSHADKNHAKYDGMERHGHVIVPIKGAKDVLGVMCYYTPAGTRPSAEEVQVLSAVAGQLAPAIENINLSKKALTVKEDLNQNTMVLAKKVSTLNALVEVDRIILSSLDRDEMLFKVSVQIRQLVPADVGGVALLDGDSGDYRYVGGWGMEIKNRDILHSADWLGSPVLNYGKPLMRRNIEEEVMLSPFDRLLQDSGVRSDLYAPIMRKGKTVGIFFLGCFREKAFSQEDVETTVRFASRMGIALEHVRLIYDLDEMSVNIIHALASAIDAKSSWTKGHSERVSDYALAIAEKMGMQRHEIDRLRLAGLLHDIGKIGTYDVLLDKTGKLTEEEWELIKLHPNRGCEILEPITEFKDILPAVRHHHERWDGKGYPGGLKGEDIPIMARILTVADSFDTMTADRPYRPAIGLSNATQEIAYCAGTQFAPDVAEVFLKLIRENGPEITNHSKPILKKIAPPQIWGTS